MMLNVLKASTGKVHRAWGAVYLERLDGDTVCGLYLTDARGDRPTRKAINCSNCKRIMGVQEK